MTGLKRSKKTLQHDDSYLAPKTNRQVAAGNKEMQQVYEDLFEYAPCAYLTLTPEGIIARINLAGEVLLDQPRKKLLQSALNQFLDPEFEEDYFLALQQADLTGNKQRVDLRLKAGAWLKTRITVDRQIGFRVILMDVSRTKEMEMALVESERRHRQLFEDMVCGMLLLENVDGTAPKPYSQLRCIDVNSAFERLTNITKKQAKGTYLSSFLRPTTNTAWLNAAVCAYKTENPVELQQTIPESGRHLSLHFFPISSGRVGITFWDVSEARKNRDKMHKTSRDLYLIVQERTDELVRVNHRLKEEIKARGVVQRELLEKTEALENCIFQKEEDNSAIDALFKRREDKRLQLEEMIVCNLNELVRPLLAKLGEGKLSRRQRGLLAAIDQGLDEISSPLSRRFILESSRLTPMETKVAEMIRQGKSSKEISMIMGVAISTIDSHRLSIRRRLGLNNKTTNLQSYLRSLS